MLVQTDINLYANVMMKKLIGCAKILRVLTAYNYTVLEVLYERNHVLDEKKISNARLYVKYVNITLMTIFRLNRKK